MSRPGSWKSPPRPRAAAPPAAARACGCRLDGGRWSLTGSLAAGASALTSTAQAPDARGASSPRRREARVVRQAGRQVPQGRRSPPFSGDLLSHFYGFVVDSVKVSVFGVGAGAQRRRRRRCVCLNVTVTDVVGRRRRSTSPVRELHAQRLRRARTRRWSGGPRLARIGERRVAGGRDHRRGRGRRVLPLDARRERAEASPARRASATASPARCRRRCRSSRSRTRGRACSRPGRTSPPARATVSAAEVLARRVDDRQPQLQVADRAPTAGRSACAGTASPAPAARA